MLHEFQFYILIGLIHCVLLFFNVIFVTCAHFPYIYFLKNSGLEIDFFRIKWCTTIFNKKFTRWGVRSSKLWKVWFDVGTLVCLILLPVAIVILINSLPSYLPTNKDSQGDDRSLKLQMMIPGKDIPMEQMAHYIMAFLITSGIHEYGHAAAAAHEEVQVTGVGMVVFYAIIACFVNLNRDQLTRLSPRKQLRILCAGVWHNIVLAVVCLVLFEFFYYIGTPFYKLNVGVYVNSLTANSPLRGEIGLTETDVVIKMNDCAIRNHKNWHDCIVQISQEPLVGYCVDETFVKAKAKTQTTYANAVADSQCCESQDLNSGHLCFKHWHASDTIKTLSCLPGRSLLNNKIRYCQTNADCPERILCMSPLINNSKLVEIVRIDKPDVIFLGNPANIESTVDVHEWVPMNTFITYLFHALAVLCRQVCIFSSGMAVVNAIPCFFFDGQHIFTVIANYLLGSVLSRKTLNIFIFSVKAFMTVLLLSTAIYMFVKKIF